MVLLSKIALLSHVHDDTALLSHDELAMSGHDAWKHHMLMIKAMMALPNRAIIAWLSQISHGNILIQLICMLFETGHHV